MSNFDSFLKKMMGETEAPKKIQEGKVKGGGVKPQTNTPRPPVKPQAQKPIVEDNDEDDIVERAFDYAATFSKIVKKNFPDRGDRRVVLESVRSAINLMLGDTSSVERPQNARENQIEVQAAEQVEGDPYELLRQAQTSRLPENFNPNAKVEGDLNIKGVLNERGETEVDLSQMTSEDMRALRVLSGIEGTTNNVPQGAEEEVRAVMNG